MTHCLSSSVALRISLRWGVEAPAAGMFLEELASFDIAGDKEFAHEGLSLADISFVSSSPYT